MSNYPPGVTGLEPEIVGEPELEIHGEVGECGMLGLYVIVEKRAWGRAQTKKQRRVSARLCTFTGGEVEGVLVGRDNPRFYWDCPVCHTENEESNPNG